MTDPVQTTLHSLWPRLNWSSFINDERPDEVITLLINIYKSIREEPRAGHGVITDEMWRNAYVESISILNALFRKTKTVAQAKDINRRFAARLAIKFEEINNLDIEKSYMYWAASKLDLTVMSSDALAVSQR